MVGTHFKLLNIHSTVTSVFVHKHAALHLAFCPACLVFLCSFRRENREVAVFSCALHAQHITRSAAQIALKAVVVSFDETIISPSRFLSSEGIAECERVCNKEKPSYQELSKAALNVSIGSPKHVEGNKNVGRDLVFALLHDCSLN